MAEQYADANPELDVSAILSFAENLRLPPEDRGRGPNHPAGQR
jgi:hypothetical protein